MRTHASVHRRILRTAAWAIAATLVSAGIQAATGAPASAYILLGCRVPGPSVLWTDGTGGGAYGTVAQSSASAWQATPTPILFSKVGGGGYVDIAIWNYGNVSFDGITEKISGGAPTCASGVWSTKLKAAWNTFYANSYSSAKKQSVMVHELGHVLGIAHSGIGPCVTVPVMYPTTAVRYDSCSINTPQSDDINAANVIY